MRTVAVILLASLTAIGCGKKPDARPEPAPEPGASQPESGDDLKAAQGEWQVISYQNPDPKHFPPEEIDQIKTVTFKVEGNVLKAVAAQGRSETFVIRLNQGKSPKEMDLVPADESGKPRIRKFQISGGPERQEEAKSTKCIYRLDKDKLFVAASDQVEYRPTEFKAAIVENTGPLVTVNKRGSSWVFFFELKRVK